VRTLLGPELDLLVGDVAHVGGDELVVDEAELLQALDGPQALVVLLVVRHLTRGLVQVDVHAHSQLCVRRATDVRAEETNTPEERARYHRRSSWP
jgi:hypothetical protein